MDKTVITEELLDDLEKTIEDWSNLNKGCREKCEYNIYNVKKDQSPCQKTSKKISLSKDS